MPIISIIIPIYNVEKYLDRCMRSLLAQTIADIEIIMVDDGSPDRCPMVCDEYAGKDSRIKVIHKQNAGLGNARNSGLDIATGDYVAFVDSDDFVDVKMYECLYASVKQEKADAAFCGFYREFSHGNWVESGEVKESKVWRGEDVRNFMLDMIACAPCETQERKYQMSVWHAIYKRSIIEDNEIRFVSERDVASEDLPFQVDFLLHAKTVTYQNAHYYYYCFNGASLTKTFKFEKFQCYKNLRTCLLVKDASEDYKNRVNRLFIGYVRSQYYNIIRFGCEKKGLFFRHIVYDDVWNEMKNEYATGWLPLLPRLIYKATIIKAPFLLMSIMVMANTARIICEKCKDNCLIAFHKKFL